MNPSLGTFVLMDGFHQRLRNFGRALNLSDAEVARRAGLSERRYGNYVAGIREPDLMTLVKIAKALSTTPDRLLGVSEGAVRVSPRDREMSRLNSAASPLSLEELGGLTAQVEALAKYRTTLGRKGTESSPDHSRKGNVRKPRVP